MLLLSPPTGSSPSAFGSDLFTLNKLSLDFMCLSSYWLSKIEELDGKQGILAASDTAVPSDQPSKKPWKQKDLVRTRPREARWGLVYLCHWQRLQRLELCTLYP